MACKRVVSTACALCVIVAVISPGIQGAALVNATDAPRTGVAASLLSLFTSKPEDYSEEEVDAVEAHNDEPATKDIANAAERGIYKKKKRHHYYHHLWHSFYYYAWIFAAIAVKFKVALLILWGHLTYFLIALIRVLIREVPLWIQLKREHIPPPQYGPSSQYGPPPQYGSYGSSGPYKRRAGDPTVAGSTNNAQELAYSGQK